MMPYLLALMALAGVVCLALGVRAERREREDPGPAKTDPDRC